MTPAAQRLPLVDLGAQHAILRSELTSAIDGVFDSSQFILGGEVRRFEEEFAAFCGTAYAIACGNGTDALELALWAVGVKPGDEVITAALTFAATAEAIVRCGAAPRFVDVLPGTLLMDVAQVEAAVTEKTAAIVPVHLYGSCVDMRALDDIARRHRLRVVEDAAQAHGASANTGRRAGASGVVGCFSFYPGKNLGACGDAGAVITEDDDVAHTIKAARDHGRTTAKYEHGFPGRNSRMDELQAAILRVKLRHLESWNARRRQIAARYRRLLEDVPAVAPIDVPLDSEPVHHLFVVRVDNRDSVRATLSERGIECGVHYPIPLHRQPAFAGQDGGMQPALPVTDAAAACILSLPMFPEMSDADVDRVVAALDEATATLSTGSAGS